MHPETEIISMDKAYKAALFDLDGVVFDTEPQYSVFWGGECRRYHPEEPGLEHKIKGQTLVQIFDKHFSGELEKRVGENRLHLSISHDGGIAAAVCLLEGVSSV